MSSIAPRPPATSPVRGAIPPPARPVARLRLVLVWSLSRAAAAGAGLAPADGEGEPLLELSAPWPGGQGADVRDVSARVIDGGAAQEVKLEVIPSGAWACDAATGLMHLDLPGLVHVTARVRGGSVAVLYARTDLLSRLGLAGGRYDFLRAEVVGEPQ